MEKTYYAQLYKYRTIKRANIPNLQIFPYLKCETNTGVKMLNITSSHGRSYVVGQTDTNRAIVLKGCGLNYTPYVFLHTNESNCDTWGLLRTDDAVRDFTIGQEVSSLGIKTNRMNSVIEVVNAPFFVNNERIVPALLQYDVECPYRIEDAIYMGSNQIWNEVTKWEKLNTQCLSSEWKIAADVIISNLRKLHDSKILHNALTIHNYTWALELLDFEIASSPSYPYSSEDSERRKQDLYDREILDVYKIIMYIADVLKEPVDETWLIDRFEKYGFYLSKFNLGAIGGSANYGIHTIRE